MCDTCGCGDPNLVSVEVHDKILSVNDRTAAHNREHFAEGGVFAVNLMGSPGAGQDGGPRGDRARPRAARAASAPSPATSRPSVTPTACARWACPRAAITTGSACHLDAEMVHKALHHFPWRELDYLFVENVGNLVCPAIYDLGQAVNVVALSVTEGEDKPLKYPVMFRKADLVLLTKVDLLPHLDFRRRRGARRARPNHAAGRRSCRCLPRGPARGVPEWISWLEARRAAQPRATAGAARSHHHHS